MMKEVESQFYGKMTRGVPCKLDPGIVSGFSRENGNERRQNRLGFDMLSQHSLAHDVRGTQSICAGSNT